MGVIHNSDVPILENAIRALNSANGDRTVSADGFGDADVAALSNPATVALAATAIEALAGFHRADCPSRAVLGAAVRLAGKQYRTMSPPTIGNVTTAIGGGAGGLDDGLTIYYAVAAVDANGNVSIPSAEDSVATGTAGANDNVNTIPWTEVAGNFIIRVYASAADGSGSAGVYTHYKDLATDVTSTTDATTVRTGWTAQANTTAGITAAARAGVGMITDDMVDDARDASLFSTLRNAVADQHPSLSTSARTIPGGSVAVGNV